MINKLLLLSVPVSARTCFEASREISGKSHHHLALPLRLLPEVGFSDLWPWLRLVPLCLEVWVWCGEYPLLDACWCC